MAHCRCAPTLSERRTMTITGILILVILILLAIFLFKRL